MHDCTLRNTLNSLYLIFLKTKAPSLCITKGLVQNDGILILEGDFNKYDDGASGVRLTIEIRDGDTHEVLRRITADNTDISKPTKYSTVVGVKKNQKIELFFDASSINNPPGFYRWAAVEYDIFIV